MSNDPRTSFNLPEQTRVRLPLALLGALFTAVALATAGWISVRADIALHAHAITALEIEVRSSRELLVRIDENVKALKEARK